MASITPADPNRCQVEITQGSAWQIGNPRRTTRCDRKPFIVLREKSPGDDGLIGEQSVCRRCIHQLPKGIETLVHRYPVAGSGAFPVDLSVPEEDSKRILALVSHSLLDHGSISCEDPDGEIIHWEGADDDVEFAKRTGIGPTSKLPQGVGPGDMRYVELDRYIPVEVDPWLWDSVCRIWTSFWTSCSNHTRFHATHYAHVCFDREIVGIQCEDVRALSDTLRLPQSRWKHNQTQAVVSDSRVWEFDIPFSDLQASNETFQ